MFRFIATVNKRITKMLPCCCAKFPEVIANSFAIRVLNLILNVI